MWLRCLKWGNKQTKDIIQRLRYERSHNTMPSGDNGTKKSPRGSAEFLACMGSSNECEFGGNGCMKCKSNAQFAFSEDWLKSIKKSNYDEHTAGI